MHRLVGAIKCDCVRVVAVGPFVFVATEILNFALLTGELAFLHVEFPLAIERIVRSPKRSGNQAGKRKQQRESFHCDPPARNYSPRADDEVRLPTQVWVGLHGDVQMMDSTSLSARLGLTRRAYC